QSIPEKQLLPEKTSRYCGHRGVALYVVQVRRDNLLEFAGQSRDNEKLCRVNNLVPEMAKNATLPGTASQP
ncbi:MAG TPA: hypothetical protein VEM32_02430, partial [Geobacteraceae bacterium]|nr:hypothetical protein [Geobacteraceae bacterium]